MNRRRLGILALASLAVAAIVASCSTSSSAPKVDPNAVAYSFVVVGCNRVAAADTAGNPSTANVAELNRTFADVAALSPKPAFFFFAGDEVLGYTDTIRLANQLQAWVALYQASPLPASGVELVAIPGNHEVQNAAHIATAGGERAWLRTMATYVGRGGNGPTAGGADNLQTDQSRLSYSFDYKDTHFVTLNTDPTGADWHAPTSWMQTDIAAARARGQKHVFVIAHKPGYAYPTVPTDGLSLDVVARTAFWNVLLNNQAEAMFSAHNHVYYRSQPASGKTWMVVSGNGGSSLEPTIDPTIPSSGKYFGFVQVSILNSGRVIAKSFGRDVPAAGYTAAVIGATTVRDSVELTWR